MTDHTALALPTSEIVPQSLGDALVEIFHLRAALATERAAREEAERLAKDCMQSVSILAARRNDFENQRDEALAAKERAERETACWRTEFRERHAEKERAEAEVIRLTAALAGAREALVSAQPSLSVRMAHALEAIDNALSHPTTEPAKAEEVNCPACGNAWDGSVCKTCGWNGVSYAPTTEPAKAEAEVDADLAKIDRIERDYQKRFEDQSLTILDIYTIKTGAEKFGVTERMFYLRAKGLGLIGGVR